MSAKLSSPLQLPNGMTFQNRIVKAAMAEGFSDPKTKNFDPKQDIVRAYEEWGKGGWGGLMSGNVDVSVVYKGGDQNITAAPNAPPTAHETWKRWATLAQKNGTPALIQLVHPGRASFFASGRRGFFKKNIAPSAIPLKLGDGWIAACLSSLIFGAPREMTKEEIEAVVKEFAASAKMVYEVGFSGVEIHGAHGFLLTQFLLPATNKRTDEYGGTPAKRAKIVIDIIRAVRKEVPASFTVGIKLNSADAQNESLEESVEQFGLIAQEQIDFVEISGGSLENPKMSGAGVNSTSKREAFFLDYAETVRKRFPNVILMVTGGFRSRKGMTAALEDNLCDLIGLGKPGVVFPHIPKELYLNKDVADENAALKLTPVRAPWLLRQLPVKFVGAGADTFFYAKQIQVIADGGKPQMPPEEKNKSQ